MKYLITIIAILIATASFAQTKTSSAKFTSNEETKITKLAMEVTIESARDLDSIFKKERIDKFFNEYASIEDITFKITCKVKDINSGLNSSVSYEIKGNSVEKDVFLEQLEKIKKAAHSFYNK